MESISPTFGTTALNPLKAGFLSINLSSIFGAWHRAALSNVIIIVATAKNNNFSV